MKKFIILIIGFLAVIAFLMWRKVRAALNLTIDVGDFKLIQESWTNYKVQLNVILKNYSNVALNVQQMKIAIYTNKDVLLLEQLKPLTNNYKLPTNDISKIPVTFNLDGTGVLNFLTTSGVIDNWTELTGAITNYLTTGTFGVPFKAVGFVKAENVQYNFNETIEL